MRTHRTLSVVIVCIALGGFAIAGSKRKIQPGPPTMSAAERALAADPAHGIEHAIILVDETDRDDDRSGFVVRHHVRAKVLDNEARDLGDIKLPFSNYRTFLQDWWARTILPDGSVQEITKDKVTEQSVAKSSSEEVRAYAAALPGIVPGAIIDYGYEISYGANVPNGDVPIQREYPVRDFYYRWTPAPVMPAMFLVTRGEQLPIRNEKDGERAIMVTASDLPALRREPLMPAYDELRAFAHFYYVNDRQTPQQFWTEVGQNEEKRAVKFNKDREALQRAIAGMNLPQGDLRARLAAAYDWIETNLTNTGSLTAEQKERRAAEDAKKKKRDEPETPTAASVLQSREGDSDDLALLFVGVARELGADAEVAFAPDRTERYFNAQLLDARQFDRTIVAVRPAGAPDPQTTFVAPGSGLPYGEVPWWNTGLPAFVASKDRSRTLSVPGAAPARNLWETSVNVRFAPEGENTLVSWSGRGTGQNGYAFRRNLRGAKADDRQKRLERSCGSERHVEVSKATLGGELESRRLGLQIDCEGQMPAGVLDDSVSEYRFRFDGPWLDELPDVGASARTQPVLFSYPSLERTTVHVTAPAGFEAATLPAPVNLETPFGAYSLSCGRLADGTVSVVRTFAITRLKVDAAAYQDLLKFFADVRRSDSTAIVFRRRM